MGNYQAPDGAQMNNDGTLTDRDGIIRHYCRTCRTFVIPTHTH
jgi:hypothetical protein